MLSCALLPNRISAFFTTNSLLCNVSLVSQFNMSKAGERSRCPKTVVSTASVEDVSDLESRMLAM